jgi:siderophore synthetase component
MEFDRFDLRMRATDTILHDLIDALFYENLFGLMEQGRIVMEFEAAEAVPNFLLDKEEKYFLLPLKISREFLLFRIYSPRFLQPYRLSRPPVLQLSPQGGEWQWKILNLIEIIGALAKDLPAMAGIELPNLEGFLEDLQNSIEQTALSFKAAKPLLAAVDSEQHPTLVKWEQVAALRDRPFHPTARTKTGWNAAEYQRFSPEFGCPFGLDWIVVERNFIHCSQLAAGKDIGSFVLDSSQQIQLTTAFEASGLSPDNYLALPVHPWQMQHKLPSIFAQELANGICVPLAQNVGNFEATSSVRSLAPVSGSRFHLKLPLGIYSLGALRNLPARYLHNGEKAQQLLKKIIAKDPLLMRCLHPCTEEYWWAFSPAGGESFAEKPDYLGCLVREYPSSLLDDPAIDLIPMSALAVITLEGNLPATSYILRKRSCSIANTKQVLALFYEICEQLTIVALRCFCYGVMPELHGQNVVLVLKDGRVEGLLLRDHDTLRLYLPWLTEAGLLDPGYCLKPNTPNTLLHKTPQTLLMYFQTLGIQVNLYAIAAAWSQAYSLDEAMLWQVVKEAIESCLSNLDFPVTARALLQQQLLDSEYWPTKRVLAPLLKRVGTGGGSMPSDQGETYNPFHSLSPHRIRGYTDG